ncbi:MAG TPA: DUF732 domain-containing protein [Streptosporangiaceae bacterium]
MSTPTQQAPGWGTPPSPQSPKPQRQHLSIGRWLLIGIAALLTLGFVIAVNSGGGTSGDKQAAPAATAVTTAPAPEVAFLAQVRASGLGNKDLAGTPDADLLALGHSVLDALDAAVATDETTAVQTVVQGLMDTNAHPTAAQAKAFVKAAITNLDPVGSGYLLDTAATPAPPTTAAPVATKSAPKHWTTVISVSGSSDKRTPAFTLHGDRARLRYTFTDSAGYGMVVGAIYVLDEGTSLAADGGIPEVMVTDPGTDSTELAQGEGRYYLDISAANAHWTVTIQELR